MPRLILMCGLPGAGKTTQAKALAAALPLVRLSPDEWLAALGFDLFDEAARERVEQQLWRHAQDLLRTGADVILENGFWGRTERDGYRRTARDLGASVHLHYLDVPLDELKRRRTVVTGAQLDEYAALFEAPDAAELARFDPPVTVPGLPGARGRSSTDRQVDN